MTTTPISKLPIAGWRVAAIHIDCPTPHCGGGVTASNGAFTLDETDVRPLNVYQPWTCEECQQQFLIPGAAKAVFTRHEPIRGA